MRQKLPQPISPRKHRIPCHRGPSRPGSAFLPPNQSSLHRPISPETTNRHHSNSPPNQFKVFSLQSQPPNTAYRLLLKSEQKSSTPSIKLFHPTPSPYYPTNHTGLPHPSNLPTPPRATNLPPSHSAPIAQSSSTLPTTPKAQPIFSVQFSVFSLQSHAPALRPIPHPTVYAISLPPFPTPPLPDNSGMTA